MTVYEWTLSKNVDGFELPIPKLKDNTLFYMSDRFLEAFLKFHTWAVTGACILENTLETTGCFVIVWQTLTEYTKNVYKFLFSIPEYRKNT